MVTFCQAVQAPLPILYCISIPTDTPDSVPELFPLTFTLRKPSGQCSATFTVFVAPLLAASIQIPAGKFGVSGFPSQTNSLFLVT